MGPYGNEIAKNGWVHLELQYSYRTGAQPTK